MSWVGLESEYSNSQDKYDTALICQNGHIVNSASNQYPEDNKNFCDKCGSKALDKCVKCSTPIKGAQLNSSRSFYNPPPFCYNCGTPFPWTILKIETAIELAVSSERIDDTEKEIIKKAVPEIVRDTPRMMLESTKMKRILFKIGNGTANMIKDTLTSIISETAKKIIWPDK